MKSKSSKSYNPENPDADNLKAPNWTLRFFRWFCNPRYVEDIEGDLLERFEKRKNVGKLAQIHFILDVLRLLRPGIIRPTGLNQRLINTSMFKNYFKITLRSLLRQKMHAVINIGGLAIGLSCFIIIFLYVQLELSYDRFYGNADQIYRVYQKNKGNFYLGTDNYAYTPMGLATSLMEDFPEVEHATTIRDCEILLSVNDNHYYEKGLAADPYFFDVFHHPLLHGNPKSVLSNEMSIVFSESLAKKVFGDENPIGKQVTYRNRDIYTVTGVMKDLPVNSSIKFSFVSSILSNGQYAWDNKSDRWGNNDYFTFLTLDKFSHPDMIESKFPDLLDKQPKTKPTPSNPRSYHLQSLSDFHLENDMNFDFGVKGNSQYIGIFSFIAIIVLLLACTNYMNLAIARSIKRAKEVGIRKVMGASKTQLIGQFIGESILITFLALLLSIGLIFLIAPIFGAWIDSPIQLNILENTFLLPFLMIIVIIVGLLSGIYPAFFMSSLQPVRTLKGKVDGSFSSISILRWLIAIQYTASIALIIGSLIIYQQFNYIKNRELGYNKEHVLTVSVFDRELMKNIDELKRIWSQNPNIYSITTTAELPTNITSGTRARNLGQTKEEAFDIYRSRMSYDYLEVFDIELIAGRDFSESFTTDIEESRIINESAAKALGWTPEEAVGKRFVDYKPKKIIGVVKDFHMHSMHIKIAPLLLMMTPDYFTYIAFKVSPEHVNETILSIEETISEYSPYPFEYKFLDDQFNQLYKTDMKFGKMVGAFTLLAILIASLGLFGLAVHTTSQRTKEIGIRKVLGASIGEIVMILAINFLKLVLVGFLVAIPIAWYAMEGWLNDFVYRIEINWWLFVLAGFITITITFLTIGFQSVKAALSNPADCLSDE